MCLEAGRRRRLPGEPGHGRSLHGSACWWYRYLVHSPYAVFAACADHCDRVRPRREHTFQPSKLESCKLEHRLFGRARISKWRISPRWSSIIVEGLPQDDVPPIQGPKAAPMGWVYAGDLALVRRICRRGRGRGRGRRIAERLSSTQGRQRRQGGGC
ncbi:hypothetical protein FA95DRAFT_1347797 [Auriscalpium vulgare]|uniref:Uncharacterized protein n=1 Tax=Auriscalpium vulgare TaxID=40419 RepID=A0ACB8RSQ6_9AGAM|nr:hypothetical protein FA95DRAFT_1347797 [Auriscalpium vulgare]